MEEHRAQRVAEAVREELEELILYELEDPRIQNVDVTDVRVSPDLRQACVLVSVRGEEALAALRGARHFLRRQLAGRLELRHTPELVFEADSGVDPERAGTLLRRIRKGRPKAAG